MLRLRSLAPALGLFLLAGAASGAESGPDAGHAAAELGERMTELVFQLAAILVAARAGAFLCRRFLKIPEVLGEVGAGILIGPYLLGPVIGLFHAPPPGAAVPVSTELYAFATVASILLLYLAGLETDVGMFLQYSVAGSLVGVGGVVVSFAFGGAAAVWTGLAPSFGSPPALFLGAIATATSVGITARVLSRRNKLDSPEGVTILAGAVVDDVLGIVVLAIVVGLCREAESGGGVAWGTVGLIGLKALGFWAGGTALGLLLAKRVSRFLEFFGSRQTMATLSLGLALLLAGLAERANLAMIIGAYIMGLSLSRVDCAHEIRQRLEPVSDTLVAVFFAVMGMMVNLREIAPVLLMGLVFTAFGVAAKLIGCGVPALLTRFRLRGALRIGVGMLPRGEVTLLMAGIGLAGGYIGPRVFGVAVLMTLVCTLVAPLLMDRLFDDRPGVRTGAAGGTPAPPALLSLPVPSAEVADLLLGRLRSMFEDEDCYVRRLGPGNSLYQVRKDDTAITVRYDGATVVVTCGEEDREFARLMLLEALAGLITVFEGIRRMQSADDLRSSIFS